MDARRSAIRHRAQVLACFVLALGFVAPAVATEAPLPLPTLPDGRFGYEEVVAVEGATPAELLSRARAWIAKAYDSANAVIQLDDAAAGSVIAKGTFSVPYTVATFTVRHTLTIQVKDGRYKFTLSPFVLTWPGTNLTDMPLEQWHGASASGTAKVCGRVATAAAGLIASMKQGMATPTPASSNW